MRRSYSIQKQIAILFTIVIIILIIILSIAIGKRSAEQVQSEIGNSLGEIAYLMGTKLDHYMWSRYGEIYLLSELMEIRQPDDLKSVQALLDRMKLTFPAFAWIGFTNKDGAVMASTNGILEGFDISARPVYTEALKDTFIGDVHEAVLLAELLPNPTGEEMKFVDISRPIYNYNSEFIGVLAAHLSWEWAAEIEESMMEPLHNRHEIEMFIVSNIEDTVLLGPKEMLGFPLELQSISQARTGDNGWLLERWPDGKEYLTGYVFADGYKDYQGLSWTVLVRQPVEVAYAPIKTLLTEILIIGIFSTMAIGVIGWLLAGRIATPIKEITFAADRLRYGEKFDIPQHRGISEIEILSSSIKKLVDNLTKTENALDEMEEAALSDPLTKLPNRTALEQHLKSAVKKFPTITLLYLDLDGFKAVNDSLGHQVGDKLLEKVASRLKQAVRSEELVARMGGDEFVIVLVTDTNPIENAKKIGNRVNTLIKEPYTIDGKVINIGCSVGGAIWSGNDVTINDVMKQADDALYYVKRTGKNSVHINVSA